MISKPPASKITMKPTKRKAKTKEVNSPPDKKKIVKPVLKKVIAD